MTETRRETIPEHDFVAHEHADMRRGIERIHEAATLRGTSGDLSFAALEVLHWVETVLEPHAQWEDRWLYPEVDERAGTQWATKLMTFEHQQIP
jgi:Hemerythrin HHE cation binding domain